jgi:polyferredoxin
MRFELTRIPIVKRILKSRWLPWSLMAITLPFIVLAIMSGLFGTPAGSRNFGIIFVWIVWWALMILIMVPLGGRFWCSLCPIPAPGEWLQRRALVQPRPGGQLYTLGKKWPQKLNNIWLQNAAFLGVALFSAVILTSPLVSALVLSSFVIVAIATSLVFERRTFCRYLCPVGGFIGLYSQVAPIEVRVKDHKVCASHKGKTCYVGSDEGYGCPWLVFPAALAKNTFCGMCTECYKTCPLDNVALYTRPFGADLLQTKGHKLDEAYKGLIMLACAMIYSTVLLGPWAFLKETARAVGTPNWLVYAAVFLTLNLVLAPGLFYLCVRVGNRLSSGSWTLASPKKTFSDYAAVLVPLGLAAWMAFTLSFVLVNFSYAWPVLSDPFGWGWNLLGTAGIKWTPYLPGLVPYLQAPILIGGLVVAISLTLRTAREHNQSPRAALPVIAFCSAFVLVMLRLYLG